MPVSDKKLPSLSVSPTLQNNKSLSFNDNNSDIKESLLANNIADRYDQDWCNKFSRFGVIDPYTTLTTTKEYVFFTKPDLCLINASKTSANRVVVSPVLESNAFFVDAINRYPDMAMQLQSSCGNVKNPFMTVLSNSIMSTVDIPGISASSIETASTVMGTTISYRGTSFKSDEDVSFNTEFLDTKNLDLYMLFKMYDEYEKLKWEAAITPYDEELAGTSRWKDYILNKILYDQIAVYKFIVAEDGMRIVYWARIVGCYPDSISRDNFSNGTNSDLKTVSIGWKGHFVRDMDPAIIFQFNRIALRNRTGRVEIPLYDTTNHRMQGKWTSCPYIKISTKYEKGLEKRTYYLSWYD